MKTGKPTSSKEILDNWKVGENYKLMRLLGRGSYGAVALAVHVPSGQRVAIKQIPGIFKDEVDCKRVFREIKLARSLSHAGVVEVFDIFAEEDDILSTGTLYLVMEVSETDCRKIIKGET